MQGVHGLFQCWESKHLTDMAEHLYKECTF